MTLSGLMVCTAALALLMHGFEALGAVLGGLGIVLLIVGRPQPSVDDVIRKGRKP